MVAQIVDIRSNTRFCPCGETRCIVSKFAKQYILECAKCGEPILHDNGEPVYLQEKDVPIIEFTLYIYNHTREQIKEKYKDNKFLLKEAMESKDVQDEETYKRERREHSSEK